METCGNAVYMLGDCVVYLVALPNYVLIVVFIPVKPMLSEIYHTSSTLLRWMQKPYTTLAIVHNSDTLNHLRDYSRE